jgi:nitrogen regulatory protein P-II 1
MKLITAIVRPEKLETIREGLEAYGVQGLTVSAASGYGRQRGYTEVYRGAEYNVDLLPKIRVEVLATDEQADDILDVIIASSNTGRAGDGKVWTVDVFDVAGASAERPHWRNVRTAQGSVAGNTCPPRGEDQSNRDESRVERKRDEGVKRAISTRSNTK